MGVAGSGKSVIGAALARALGIEFVEGDEYHSAENVERMSRGIPLTDDDRARWLRSLAARIREAKGRRIGLGKCLAPRSSDRTGTSFALERASCGSSFSAAPEHCSPSASRAGADTSCHHLS